MFAMQKVGFSCPFLLALLLVSSFGTSSDVETYKPAIKLVSERIDLARGVALYKWQNNQSIEAPAQEASVLASVATQANASGLDQAFARQFFQDQINASKIVQYAYFALWQANGAPNETAPDLSTVLRVQIGNVTSELVQALVPVQFIRASTNCTSDMAEGQQELEDAGEITTNPEGGRVEAMGVGLSHMCAS